MRCSKRKFVVVLILALSLLLTSCGFMSKKFKLTTNTVEGEGKIVRSLDQKEYKKGSKVRLAAKGNGVWEFYEWTGDLKGNKNPYDVIVDRNLSIGAKFDRAPVLKPIGDRTADKDMELSFKVTATDADDDDLVYSVTSGTAGLVDYYDEDTRIFAWTPTYSDAGSYEITFSVSDGKLTTEETITITVVDCNRAPKLGVIGSKAIREGENLYFSISASDSDGDELTFSAEGELKDYFNPSTQTFNWTSGYTDGGSYDVTFIVSDGKLTDEETITITVGDINTAPELNSIGNKAIQEGENLSFSISANDPEGDELIYSAKGALKDYFNSSTHTFNWTPTYGDAGSYDITFSVSDGKLTDEETITITVGDINTAPKLKSIGNKAIQEGENLSFSISANDPEGDELIYSAEGTLKDHFNSLTQTFNWTPTYSDAGSYDITFSVSDGKLTDQELITITVANIDRVPVLNSVGNKSIDEKSWLNFQVSGYDPDGDPVELSVSGLPDGASFNILTGEFDWNPDYDDAGSYQVTFTAVANGKMDSETITITVNDIIRPINVSIDQDYINNGNKTAMSFTFSDAEVGRTYTYSIEDENAGTITRSGTIIDPNQQISGIDVSSLDDGTLTLIVYLGTQENNGTDMVIKDTVAPNFVSVSETEDGTYKARESIRFDVELDESDLIVTANLSVLDRDFNSSQVFNTLGSGTYSYTTNALDQNGNMQEGTSIAVSIVATDVAGNSITDNSLCLLLDKTLPNAPVLNGITAGNYNKNQSFTVSGESGATIEYSLDDGINWSVYSSVVTLSNKRTYKVIARQIDIAGNQSSNSSVVAVTIDKTAPAVPTVSGITTGSYNTDQSFTISGESGAILEYSLDNGTNWSTYSSSVPLSAEGTYEVLARQTDTAGNQSSNSSVVTVTIDKTAPATPVVSGITTGSYNTDQSFTVNGESGATIEYSLNSGTNWSTYSSAVPLSAEGTYEVLARQTDTAGNQSSNSSVVTVTIDKTAPAAPTVSGITTGSYNTDQSFTLSGESGATLEYSLDNGTNWTTYSSIVSLSAEGIYEVLARQTDLAGNQSVDSSVVTVTIDKTAPAIPTVSGITTGSYNTDQSFTVSGESGATLEYSLDNGINWSTYSSAVPLSAEGTYEVLARQTDTAGNQSSNSNVVTVTIDKTAPATPTVSGITTGSYNTDQSFTLNGESGATLEYSLNNGTNWSTYSSAVSLSVEGTYEVIVKQTDAAGNQSSNSSVVTITIDKTAPVAPTVSGITTGSYNTDQSFTVNGESGATIEYSLNNGTNWSTYSSAVSLSVEGTYEVIVKQTDGAGNQSPYSSTINMIIDKTGPSVISLIPSDGTTNVDVNTDVVVVFDESLDPNTKGTINFGSQTLTFVDGSNCTITFSTTTLTNDTVTINPNESLNGETSYSNITIEGFKDQIGNDMNSYNNSLYDFTTIALAPSDYIARWRFENNYNDETGNYNASVLSGSPNFNSADHKEGSNSLNVNDAHIRSENMLPKLSTNSVSISAWFYADSSATSFPTLVEYDTIISIYYDATNSKIIGKLDYSEGRVEISAVNKATWYHVVVTYDGNELKLYLDGGNQTDSSNVVDEINLANQKHVFLGNSGNDYHWQGLFDDVIIFNRTLSGTEVSNIYNSY